MSNHTPNELFIIKLLSDGNRVKDIAKLKERSIKTVEATLYTMRKKYLCRSVAQLVYKFSKEGLI
jgi:DNA-binding NarL/FixJ family response regulator